MKVDSTVRDRGFLPCDAVLYHSSSRHAHCCVRLVEIDVGVSHLALLWMFLWLADIRLSVVANTIAIQTEWERAGRAC